MDYHVHAGWFLTLRFILVYHSFKRISSTCRHSVNFHCSHLLFSFSCRMTPPSRTCPVSPLFSHPACRVHRPHQQNWSLSLWAFLFGCQAAIPMRRFVYCKVVLTTSLVWVLVDAFLLLYFSECNKCDDRKDHSLLPALRGEFSA